MYCFQLTPPVSTWRSGKGEKEYSYADMKSA